MYLVFKSANAAVKKSKVLWAEVSIDTPSYVTKTSDMVYVNLGEMTTANKALVNKIYNNIGNITLDVIVSDSTAISTGVILNLSDSATRKLDPAAWNASAPMAWVRMTGTASMLNL